MRTHLESLQQKSIFRLPQSRSRSHSRSFLEAQTSRPWMVTQLQPITRFWNGVYRRTVAKDDGGRTGYSRPEVSPPNLPKVLINVIWIEPPKITVHAERWLSKTNYIYSRVKKFEISLQMTTKLYKSEWLCVNYNHYEYKIVLATKQRQDSKNK